METAHELCAIYFNRLIYWFYLHRIAVSASELFLETPQCAANSRFHFNVSYCSSVVSLFSSPKRSRYSENLIKLCTETNSSIFTEVTRNAKHTKNVTRKDYCSVDFIDMYANCMDFFSVWNCLRWWGWHENKWTAQTTIQGVKSNYVVSF